MLKTSRRVAHRHLAVAALATVTFAATACAPTDEADSGSDAGSSDSSSESSSETPAADECTPDTMETVTDGTLTVATDDPADAGLSTTTRPTARAMSPRWRTPSPSSSATPRTRSSG